MAKDNLVSVTITIVTLDHEISRYLEPRTSAPARRLLAMTPAQRTPASPCT